MTDGMVTQLVTENVTENLESAAGGATPSAVDRGHGAA